MTARLWVDADTPAAALRPAADVLAAGGIVAYPTDTLYGLGVDPRLSAAVDRLCRLKGRDPGVGVPLIAADLAQVEACLGALPPLGRRLAQAFWPGPLTVVFQPVAELAAAILGADGSLAVRVPGTGLSRRLAEVGGHPITATSANRAGMAPASTGREVTGALGPAVALVLEQRAPLAGPPSTIVDTRGDGPVLLRAGAISWSRVLQSLA
jgi:L-threonylcarbamoyladenylate synthase